jgi:hypothetical protein
VTEISVTAVLAGFLSIKGLSPETNILIDRTFNARGIAYKSLQILTLPTIKGCGFRGENGSLSAILAHPWRFCGQTLPPLM